MWSSCTRWQNYWEIESSSGESLLLGEVAKDTLAKENHPVIVVMSRLHCEEGQCRLVTSSNRSIVGRLAQFRARCGIGQHQERIP
jgi:hypothetical protein